MWYSEAPERVRNLTGKVGRNDPCPCGSGRKYKECCLRKGRGHGRGSPPADLWDSGPYYRLALMRLGETVRGDPEVLDELSALIRAHAPGLDIREGLERSWNSERLRTMSTDDIILRLASIGIAFDVRTFERLAALHVSAIQLAELHLYTQEVRLDGDDEEFVWLAACELWRRLLPGRPCVELLDEAVQDGYRHAREGRLADCLSSWGVAWRMALSLIPGDVMSVGAANEWLPVVLTQDLDIWCGHFEEALRMAERRGASPPGTRFQLCRELRERFPDSDGRLLFHVFAAEAESHAMAGDMERADGLFEVLAERFPQYPEVYERWGDAHLASRPGAGFAPDYDGAEDIYLRALDRYFPRRSDGAAVPGSREHIVLVGMPAVGKTTLGRLAAANLGMPFVDLEEDMGRAEDLDIDGLLERHGEEGLADRLIDLLAKGLSGDEATVFAVPGRCVQRPGFWGMVRGRANTIHLLGRPMEVYSRTDMWLGGRRMTEEEKLEERWVRDHFEDIFWGMMHCGAADHTVPVVGDVRTDTRSLCEMIGGGDPESLGSLPPGDVGGP